MSNLKIRQRRDGRVLGVATDKIVTDYNLVECVHVDPQSLAIARRLVRGSDDFIW